MEKFTKKRNIVYAFICIIAVLCLTMSCITAVSRENRSADAAVISSYAQVAGGTDLLLADYKTRDNVVFNGKVLSDLYEKISGKGKVYNDVLKDSNSAKAGTAQGSIHTGLDSNDIRGNNSGQNVVVTLGGLKWLVTSLSTGTDDKGNTVPIATLWLVDGLFNSKWNTWSADNFTYDYPSSMYSSSYVRARLLNGVASDGSEAKYIGSANASTLTSLTKEEKQTDYALNPFILNATENADGTKDRSNGSITDFLIKPKQVSYQLTQNMRELDTATTKNGWDNGQNDALAEINTGWYNNTVKDIQNKSGGVDGQGYYAWGEDYIWLPSWLETGWNVGSGFKGSNGLWNTDIAMRSSSNISRLRSGHCYGALKAYGLEASGAYHNSVVDAAEYSVRPAIHLNLASADENSATLVSAPIATTKVYDGTAQDVSDQSWFTAIFADKSKMQVRYVDNTGNPSSVVDVGTYTVEFTIKDTDKLQWSNAPDVSKGETDFVRKINFTITQKPITVTAMLGSDKLPKAELADINEICPNDSPPSEDFLYFQYTSIGSTAPYDSPIMPTAKGDYRATVKIKNSNYKTKETYYVDFSISEKRVAMPIFTNPGLDSLVYTGTMQMLTLSTLIDGVEYGDYLIIEKASGGENANYEFADDSHKTIKVTNAGEYELVIKLNQEAGACRWLDQADAKDRKLKFTVAPRTINLDVTDDKGNTGALSVNGGNKLKIIAEAMSSFVGNDGGTVKAKFYAKYGEVKIALTESITILDDDTMEIELGTHELTGGATWKLVVESENNNYEFVTDTDIEVKQTSGNTKVSWRLKIGGAVKDRVSAELSDTDLTYGKTLTYDGKEYEFVLTHPDEYEIDKTFGTNGYKNSVGKDAGSYITEVQLKEKGTGDTIIFIMRWEIEKAKFDLSAVKWKGNGQLEYDKVNGSEAVLENVPEGLKPIYQDNTGQNVGDNIYAKIIEFQFDSAYPDVADNYILPDETDPTTYIEDSSSPFEWSKTCSIIKAVIKTGGWKNKSVTDSNGKAFDVLVLRDPRSDGGIVEYEYYETDSTGKIIDPTKPIKESDLVWSGEESKYYIAKPILQDTNNYELENPEAVSKVFRIGKDLTKVQVSLEKSEMEYNSNPRHAKIKVADGKLPTNAFDVTYYDGYAKLATAPTNVGKYRVEISIKNSYIDKYQIDGEFEFDYEIVKGKIDTTWNTQYKPPVLNLKYGQIKGIEYEIRDAEGNVIANVNDLKVGEEYTIIGRIKGDQQNNYEFAGGALETQPQTFSIAAGETLRDPNSPNHPAYPTVDPDLPTDPEDPSDPTKPTEPGKEGDTDFAKVGEFVKKWWQVIASGVSIVLAFIFFGKGIGYASKRKQAKRTIESKYKTVYATGLFGLTMTNWTVIASVLMGVAVLGLVFMIIEKTLYSKTQRELEDAKDEFERNKEDSEIRRREEEDRRREDENRRRDEEMKMMFMHMMGGAGANMGSGGAQGAAYTVQSGIGAEEIRGIISETVTALLPGVQQLLPQQASSSLSDEMIKYIADSLKENKEEIRKNDETIKQMMRNQEMLMHKILELSAQNNAGNTQVVEKIVEKPVEKIVEKEVRVEVPVEKIVEKEVIKEVKVEVPVEKIVEKVVEKAVPVAAAPKAKKEVAPRLTLDEAYEKLSKQQKKFFDGLREYAMKKEKCKEKKSTYNILLGQSSVNPLVKLTIKKDVTVALFKMEDEYLKDIRRNAGSDGTKVKVKETEVAIGDAQAYATAKEMIDLREDQIERYQDFLKEQRSMKNR